MEHQWFCGGKDPCACMDSWKEDQLEKAAKTKAEEWAKCWMRRIELGEPYSRMIGESDAAEIDRRLEEERAIIRDTLPSFEEQYISRLEANVGKAITDDPAKPVLTPLGEEEFADIKQRLRSNPHYREMVERAAVEELEIRRRMANAGKAMLNDTAPSLVPPFGPLPGCVHEWAFLRYDTSLEVDVFFCRRCLEYRTKEG